MTSDTVGCHKCPACPTFIESCQWPREVSCLVGSTQDIEFLPVAPEGSAEDEGHKCRECPAGVKVLLVAHETSGYPEPGQPLLQGGQAAVHQGSHGQHEPVTPATLGST